MSNLPALATVETFKNQIIHTDLLTLCRSLPPQSVDMILADLPYQITQNEWDVMIPLEPMWAAFERVIKPECAIVLTASQPFASALVMSNQKLFRYETIWKKTRKVGFLNAKKRPLTCHENILIFSKGNEYYKPMMRIGDWHKRGDKSNADRGTSSYGKFNDYYEWTNEYYPESVIEFAHDCELTVTLAHRPNKLERHPTQKPVALFEYLIETYTRQGDIVLDPCVGSGTTAIAAYKTGRDFICGDIREDYVRIARERLDRARLDKPIPVANGLFQQTIFQGAEV